VEWSELQHLLLLPAEQVKGGVQLDSSCGPEQSRRRSSTQRRVLEWSFCKPSYVGPSLFRDNSLNPIHPASRFSLFAAMTTHIFFHYWWVPRSLVLILLFVLDTKRFRDRRIRIIWSM
jgi:hypothetical protein